MSFKLIALYLLPFITAGVGWLTNYIAVKMLFRPRKPISFFFFKVQGIFPKRQLALSEKLGELVSKELFSIEDIKKNLDQRALQHTFLKAIEERIDYFLEVRLKEEMPLATMFLSDDLKGKIKATLINEVKLFLPEMFEKLLLGLEEKIDIKQIVYEKVRNFSIDKLEDILLSIMKKEFRFIELIGAFLGFIIGLFQVSLFFYF